MGAATGGINGPRGGWLFPEITYSLNAAAGVLESSQFVVALALGGASKTGYAHPKQAFAVTPNHRLLAFRHAGSTHRILPLNRK
jgi:hypothetical protein